MGIKKVNALEGLFLLFVVKKKKREDLV